MQHDGGDGKDSNRLRGLLARATVGRPAKESIKILAKDPDIGHDKVRWFKFSLFYNLRQIH